MSKRVLNLVESEEFTPEELEDLAEVLKDVAEKRRKLSPIDRVRSSIHVIELKYDSIEPSNDWRECELAVSQVEEIDFKVVFDKILVLNDINDRWIAAIEATITFAAILFDVESWGEKLVNGSNGEFCPNLASKIVEFWRRMITKHDRPTNSIIQQLKDEEIGQCLGDYGDLSFVLQELKASRVVVQGTDGPEEAIVYDLISDEGDV